MLLFPFSVVSTDGCHRVYDSRKLTNHYVQVVTAGTVWYIVCQVTDVCLMYCVSDSSVQSAPPLPTVSRSNSCISCSLLLVAIGPVAVGTCIYC